MLLVELREWADLRLKKLEAQKNAKSPGAQGAGFFNL